MAVFAAPYTKDSWLFSTSTASTAVASVLGIGILGIGYVAKNASAITSVVQLDAARGQAMQQLGTLKDSGSAEPELKDIERRIAILTTQINQTISRVKILRRIIFFVHLGWMGLFVAGFFALMQMWHHSFWIGTCVGVIFAMFAVLMFVCGALYETYIMMDTDYMETEYIKSLPNKKRAEEELENC